MLLTRRIKNVVKKFDILLRFFYRKLSGFDLTFNKVAGSRAAFNGKDDRFAEDSRFKRENITPLGGDGVDIL